MIILIDNYDSITFNLNQYMGIFEPDIKVVRNDRITIEEIKQLNPDRIVLSPGPKSPKEAGICMDVVKEFYDKKPLLGICLGHQCMGAAFGATVGHAKELFHGKQSVIQYEQDGIFAGITGELAVARYHSLAVEEATLPACVKVTARTEDGEVMAMEHKDYPMFGRQFHPESIYTDHGKKMIENFIRI